uniref:Uncharacterized protein n=2 Tax=Cacopsylla melanoneura TaxID=428564 RepID=A0A8D8YZF6_9HEMI
MGFFSKNQSLRIKRCLITAFLFSFFRIFFVSLLIILCSSHFTKSSGSSIHLCMKYCFFALNLSQSSLYQWLPMAFSCSFCTIFVVFLSIIKYSFASVSLFGSSSSFLLASLFLANAASTTLLVQGTNLVLFLFKTVSFLISSCSFQYCLITFMCSKNSLVLFIVGSACISLRSLWS